MSAQDPDFKEFFNVNDPKTKVLLDGALLNKTKGPDGDYYSFIHKTILEFFSMLAAVDNVQNIKDGELEGKKKRDRYIKKKQNDKKAEKAVDPEE